mmetsp:Transcript_59696/g.168204  ORF Transcript_59696/g.168204 Transcript_59696/m.168204 type:complete len:218 (+) Transcript_59696:210-863(+)
MSAVTSRPKSSYTWKRKPPPSRPLSASSCMPRIALMKLSSSTAASMPPSCSSRSFWPPAASCEDLEPPPKRIRTTGLAASRKDMHTAPRAVKRLTPPWLKPTHRSVVSEVRGSHSIAVTTVFCSAISFEASTMSNVPRRGQRQKRSRCWPSAEQRAMMRQPSDLTVTVTMRGGFDASSARHRFPGCICSNIFAASSSRARSVGSRRGEYASGGAEQA